MSKNAWLTVDTIPAATTTRTITLPDGEPWLAILRGALSPLIDEANFEQFGTLTPAEMADEWFRIFNDFLEDPPMLIPPGVIMAYGGYFTPAGWLDCDGGEVSRTEFAALYEAIGDNFGDGDGSTTFNLPLERGRVLIGQDSTDPPFQEVGFTGGSQTHLLTEAEMPSHTHIQNSHLHSQSHVNALGAYNATGANAGPAYNTINTGGTVATNQNTGGGQAHNNMPPYLVVTYIIKT